MRMRKFITIEDIYTELRQQIVDRSIPPGRKLTESFLSQKWNVSRTPIREVLRRLESQGLVTSHRYKGVIVNTISIDDIDQIYAIKIHLEGLAGRLATPVISENPKQLKNLEKLCKKMEELSKKGDIGGYITKNNEFHFSIWHSCGNMWLVRILENLNSQINRFIVKSLHIPHRMERSLPEHWEIYRRVKLGKGKGVEKAIGDHFTKAAQNLKSEIMKPR